MSGVLELQRKLAHLQGKVTPGKLESAIRAGLLIVEADAKRRAPVLTGALRSSIHTETQSSGKGATGRTGTNIEYGPFVELGTFRASARPYLRPAMDVNRADALREVVDVLEEMTTP